MASSSAFRDMQRDLEAKANELSKLQKEIASLHQRRKTYTIQLGENELVLKELDLLNEGANVYKLIGPVLVKQDLAEANANVRKRIDYMTAELLSDKLTDDVWLLTNMKGGVEFCKNVKEVSYTSQEWHTNGIPFSSHEVDLLCRKRLDGILQDLEAKQNSKKDGILKLQQRLQSLQAGKAKA